MSSLLIDLEMGYLAKLKIHKKIFNSCSGRLAGPLLDKETGHILGQYCRVFSVILVQSQAACLLAWMATGRIRGEGGAGAPVRVESRHILSFFHRPYLI